MSIPPLEIKTADKAYAPTQPSTKFCYLPSSAKNQLSWWIRVVIIRQLFLFCGSYVPVVKIRQACRIRRELSWQTTATTGSLPATFLLVLWTIGQRFQPHYHFRWCQIRDRRVQQKGERVKQEEMEGERAFAHCGSLVQAIRAIAKSRWE